jgi:hypothetical protein
MLPNALNLFELLDHNGVEYVIIGGVAATVHGSATATYDLDLCYSRNDANLERVARALAPLHPHLRGADADLPFKFDAQTLRNGLNFTLSTDAGDLDLMGEVAGVGAYGAVLANSEDFEIYNRKRHVLKLDALIHAKRAAGRPKDLNAIPELEALLALRNRKS